MLPATSRADLVHGERNQLNEGRSQRQIHFLQQGALGRIHAYTQLFSHNSWNQTTTHPVCRLNQLLMVI